jgi:hypothetical protein
MGDNMNNDVNILAISDKHCGHLVGLTPPEWQIPYSPTSRSQRSKFARVQHEVWDWYVSTLKLIGPVDHVFSLGDDIDGDGGRSGGSELITTDRDEQSDMAVACNGQIKVRKTGIMVYGTPYHTGQKEDYETQIAREMGWKIGSHEQPTIAGKTFDLKHKVGSSRKKELRYTAIANEIVANREWAQAGQQKLADCVIRGHVHYYKYIEDEDSIGVVCPAMQGYGSKYGARQCSGRVNIGLLLITIRDGEITVNKYLADKELKSLKAK